MNHTFWQIHFKSLLKNTFLGWFPSPHFTLHLPYRAPRCFFRPPGSVRPPTDVASHRTSRTGWCCECHRWRWHGSIRYLYDKAVGGGSHWWCHGLWVVWVVGAVVFPWVCWIIWRFVGFNTKRHPKWQIYRLLKILMFGDFAYICFEGIQKLQLNLRRWLLGLDMWHVW